MSRRDRLAQLTPRERNVLLAKSTTSFPSERGSVPAKSNSRNVAGASNWTSPHPHSTRPGHGPAVAYQNQMRELGNLNTQDYSSATHPAMTGARSPRPGQAHLDSFVRSEFKRFDFNPVGLEDGANAFDAMAAALWNDGEPDVQRFGGEVRTYWRAKKISDDVKEKMRFLFGDAGNRDNVWQNAIKHALWSFQLTRELGAEKAKRITDAHERGQANSLYVLMDLHNNEVGRELAADPANKDRSPLSVVWQAYRGDELMIAPPAHPSRRAK